MRVEVSTFTPHKPIPEILHPKPPKRVMNTRPTGILYPEFGYPIPEIWVYNTWKSGIGEYAAVEGGRKGLEVSVQRAFHTRNSGIK